MNGQTARIYIADRNTHTYNLHIYFVYVSIYYKQRKKNISEKKYIWNVLLVCNEEHYILTNKQKMRNILTGEAIVYPLTEDGLTKEMQMFVLKTDDLWL